MSGNKVDSLTWRRYSLMIISILIAVILWAYVNNLQNPLQEQEFRITLTSTGLPQGMMIIDELPERVSIRVKPGITVSGLKAEDFRATVDLSNVSIGENKLSVKVSGPNGVQISNIEPRTVTVNIDKLVQKQVPVQAFLKGEPAAGYSAGEPVLVPNAVLASGPSKVLETIEQVPVTVDISGARQNVDYSLPLSVQNKQVSLSPELVRVVVPINITVPYESLPVKVVTTGTLGDEYELVSTAAEPAMVRVFAPQDVLSQIREVRTKAVSLENVTGNIKRTVELELPAGAALLQPSRVEVTIQLRQKQQPPQEEPAEPQQPETE